METNRNKYSIIVALDKLSPLKDLALVFGTELTKKYGGCTITNALGFWAQDGEQFKDTYGKQMVEHARKFEVVTMDEQRAEVQQLFRDAIIKCALWNDYDYSGQWIHFEQVEINCEHFQI